MAGFCVAAQEEMQSELTKELLKVEVAGIKQELTIRGEILYVLSDLWHVYLSSFTSLALVGFPRVFCFFVSLLSVIL